MAEQTAAEARAEYEAQRAASKTLRDQRLTDAFPNGDPGRWLSVASVALTALFAVVTVLAAVDPDAFIVAYFVTAVSLFALGMLVFLFTIIAMALRSRDDQLSIAGLFLLSESAPKGAKRMLLGSLAVQVIVAIAGAAVRPFTPLAVGTLVPLLGLGVTGLWAVRYGYFQPHGTEAAASGSADRS